MKRRTLLKSLSLASTSGLAVCVSATPRSTTPGTGGPDTPTHTAGHPAFGLTREDSLLAQSGIYGRELFVIGVLRCADPQAVQHRINLIRQRTGFRCRLSHRSCNKFKAPFLAALLDDWANNEEVFLYFRIVRPSPNKQHVNPATRISAYVGDVSSALSMGTGLAGTKARVVSAQLFDTSKPGEPGDILLTRNRRINSVVKIKSKQSDLLQFLSAMTGMLRAMDLTADNSTGHNQIKSDCIAKLQDTFGLANLRQGKLSKRLQIAVV